MTIVTVAPADDIAADQSFIAQRWPTEWGTVTAARESRNTIILGLNAEGWNNRRVAAAVECSEWTVRDVLRGNHAKSPDPRGGPRKRITDAPPRTDVPTPTPTEPTPAPAPRTIPQDADDPMVRANWGRAFESLQNVTYLVIDHVDGAHREQVANFLAVALERLRADLPS